MESGGSRETRPCGADVLSPFLLLLPPSPIPADRQWRIWIMYLRERVSRRFWFLSSRSGRGIPSSSITEIPSLPPSAPRCCFVSLLLLVALRGRGAGDPSDFAIDAEGSRRRVVVKSIVANSDGSSTQGTRYPGTEITGETCSRLSRAIRW